MPKRNHKKTYLSKDISSKNSVLEDQLIGGLDNKYEDSVQKLIDIGKEKGYLLYDEVSDLLPPEIGASAEVEIAKRIERGQLTVLKVLSRSPVIVGEIITLGDQLKRNPSIIKDILRFSD